MCDGGSDGRIAVPCFPKFRLSTCTVNTKERQLGCALEVQCFAEVFCDRCDVLTGRGVAFKVL